MFEVGYQPVSDVVEARLSQKHLGNYLSTQSQTRRCMQALGKFFSNFGHCFEVLGFALDPNNGLQTLSKTFLYYKVPYTRKRIAIEYAVSPMLPAKKSLGTFLICPYITAVRHCNCSQHKSLGSSL